MRDLDINYTSCGVPSRKARNDKQQQQHRSRSLGKCERPQATPVRCAHRADGKNNELLPVPLRAASKSAAIINYLSLASKEAGMRLQ